MKKDNIKKIILPQLYNNTNNLWTVKLVFLFNTKNFPEISF